MSPSGYLCRLVWLCSVLVALEEITLLEQNYLKLLTHMFQKVMNINVQHVNSLNIGNQKTVYCRSTYEPTYEAVECCVF